MYHNAIDQWINSVTNVAFAPPCGECDKQTPTDRWTTHNTQICQQYTEPQDVIIWNTLDARHCHRLRQMQCLHHKERHGIKSCNWTRDDNIENSIWHSHKPSHCQKCTSHSIFFKRYECIRNTPNMLLPFDWYVYMNPERHYFHFYHCGEMVIFVLRWTNLMPLPLSRVIINYIHQS